VFGGPGHGPAEAADAVLADETAAAANAAGVLSEGGVARRERVAPLDVPRVLRGEPGLGVFGVALRLDERPRLLF
jgi:hypothetical protein